MTKISFTAEYKNVNSKSEPLLLVNNFGKIIIMGDINFRDAIFCTLKIIFNLDVGKGLLCEIHTKLKELKENLYIYQYGESIVRERSQKIIMAFNINEKEFNKENGRGTETLPTFPVTNLGHELMHVWDRLKLNDADKTFNNMNCTYLDPDSEEKSFLLVFYKEVRAVELENKIRKELGLPHRTHYGGVNVYNKKRPEKVKADFAKSKDNKFVEGDMFDYDGMFFYLEQAKEETIIQKFDESSLEIAPEITGYSTFNITDFDSEVKTTSKYLEKEASLTIMTFI